MKKLTIEEQIENFRPLAKRGLLLNFNKWLIAISAALVILSVILWNPIPLMFAIFLFLVGIFERSAGPNIEAALNAYDTAEPALGEATIKITSWDMDNHYHARIEETGQPVWEYEFVPQGWEPAAGCHAAKIWRSGSGAYPVLTIVEDGILIPRYKPAIPKEDSAGSSEP